MRHLLVVLLVYNVLLTSCNDGRPDEVQRTFLVEKGYFELNPNEWKTTMNSEFEITVPVSWKKRDIKNPILIESFETDCGKNSKFNFGKNLIKDLGDGDPLEKYVGIIHGMISKDYNIRSYNLHQVEWEDDSIVIGDYEVYNDSWDGNISVCFCTKKEFVFEFFFFIPKESKCDSKLFNKIIFNTKFQDRNIIEPSDQVLSDEKILFNN